MKCSCGSSLEYSKCCEPIIQEKKLAETPEALMRARYSAYVKSEVHFLRESLAPDSRADFSEKDVRDWSKHSEWLGLEIIAAKGDTVEFNAKYKTEGKILEHHEVSTFKKIAGKWYFQDGESHTHEEGTGHEHHHAEPKVPVVREAPKLGRNDPCSCGSGKKFKKCCGIAA